MTDTALPLDLAIAAPGVYLDIPDETYHRDPVVGGSLSSTGARKLQPPSCPAKFHYERSHPRPPKRELDFGRAAHSMLLGKGADLKIIDALDYKTKAAQQAKAAAYAAGEIPVLPWEYDQIEDMALALRQHEYASMLLDPELTHVEVTLVWRDKITGVMCRARIDCMRNDAQGQLLIVDYKTAVSSEPSKISKVIADRGYHQQFDWYISGAMELGLTTRPVPLLIVQEKEPPYVVTVARIPKSAMDIADIKNRAALEIYKQCTETGVWPGYVESIVQTPLPPYEERKFNDELDAGVYDIKGKKK
ncbi:hypothetical protein GCM10027258_63090 [Amycolatopsis stemonae]